MWPARTALTLAIVALIARSPVVPPVQRCDRGRIESAYSDSNRGVSARAFIIVTPRGPRALVAVRPFGPAWAGYLLLATCDGRTLDSVGTGAVDSVAFLHVTPRHRAEALIRSTSGTGTGAATHTLWVVAVEGEVLRILWARPVLDYGSYDLWGGRDSAEVTFPAPGVLRYQGVMQRFARVTREDTLETDGPPCAYSDTWRWKAAPDTFALVTVPSSRARCGDP